jgi:hypothetical protein
MTRALPPAKVPLDQLFQPPIGAEESFTRILPADRTITDNKDGTLPGGSGTQETGADPEAEYYIGTPANLQVIDQKLRRAPGGQQVVDIVLQCSDVIGALEYEVQIAKV